MRPGRDTGVGNMEAKMSRLITIVAVSLVAGLAIGAWISVNPEAPAGAPAGEKGDRDG